MVCASYSHSNPNLNDTTVLSTSPVDRLGVVRSVGDAAHAVGVHVRRHGLGQREAVGDAFEGGRELDVERRVARAQRHHLGPEPDTPVASSSAFVTPRR